MKSFKVICIDSIYSKLILHKKYNAKKMYGHYCNLLCIYDENNNYIDLFNKDRFITIDEIRKERINEII